jgi:hypothetical protein
VSMIGLGCSCEDLFVLVNEEISFMFLIFNDAASVLGFSCQTARHTGASGAKRFFKATQISRWHIPDPSVPARMDAPLTELKLSPPKSRCSVRELSVLVRLGNKGRRVRHRLS